MAFEPVRSSHVPLHLHVDPSGVVGLRGWVRSRGIKDWIAETTRRVPGVTSLNLALVVDPELEIKVARALATAPQTAGLPPGTVVVRAYYGTVRLIGHVPDAAQIDGVDKVASQVDGVRRVENELTSINAAIGKK
jgi:osmotically-inducible protein OsmY